MKNKPAAKRAGPPTGKPFQKGNDPRRNTSTAGPGRPPDEFKARMRAMGSNETLLEHVETVLKDPNHPDWSKMVSLVWDRGYGKAQQHMDVTTGGGPITVVSGVPESLAKAAEG